MNTEPSQSQLDKWRRQEHFNKILVRCVFSFLMALALVGIGYLVVNLFKGTPTLTPSVLTKEWAAREGQIVRLRGEVSLIDETRVRIREGNESVLCNFLRTPEGLEVGHFITVEGMVSHSNGLTNCKLAAE